MNNKRASFFRQTGVLISRYLKIFFNDKQSLLLNIAIPLLTIAIVCLVATDDMFPEKTLTDHSINNGYPVLAWQQVVQEENGEFTVSKSGIGKTDEAGFENDPFVYMLLDENDFSSVDNVKCSFYLDSKPSEITEINSGDVKISKGDSGIYMIGAFVNENDIDANCNYKATFTGTVTDNNNKSSELSQDVEFHTLDKFDDYDDVSEYIDLNDFYSDVKTVSADFDVNDYYQDHYANLVESMEINGDKYIVVGDADTLAYLFSKEKGYGDNTNYEEKNIYLNCNVDMSNFDSFMPLGGADNPYSGIFDGNGHVISGIDYETEKDNSGLFGVVTGTVKNLGIENSSFKTNGKNAGAFAGTLKGNAKLDFCYVSDGEDAESVVYAQKGYAGGLVGNAVGENVEISNCYSTIKVEADGDYIGGLLGSGTSVTCKACYSISKLESDGDNPNENSAYCGALTGRSDDITMSNCYYSKDNVSVLAVGQKDASVDIDENNVKGVSSEKLKEYAEQLAYENENPDDDATYAFKSDGQLGQFVGTQTGLFMLVCVAIFVGICNSIQEVCKERNILKREYMTNLRLSSYVVSKLVVQAMVCAVQMIFVLLIFAIFTRSKELPAAGVILPSVWIEFYITMFLLTFAADTMSLVISSIVKTSATANTFIPIILIVQIVFSGVLFDLGDVMDKFASLMISKWGIAGLAASTRLNNDRNSFLLSNPDFELQLGKSMASVKSLYMSDAGNLIKIWCILIVFTVVCAVLSGVILTRVKKDQR